MQHQKPSRPRVSAVTPELRYTIIIPGHARGKGRPRFSRFGGGRTFTDSKTVNAEAWVKSCAIDVIGGMPPMAGHLLVEMTVHVEVPKSWSKKKRADALSGALRPTGKPDLDNTAKLHFDALNGIVWSDDAQIVEAHLRKLYAEAPQTILTVREA
ncbi:RusA family crossover junction endodeoxyribonuclease [Acidisoma cellulosilytica]|uniref:RusA family crossover junction endodeoxyribonuclease n=1 Tax=Acidisoma cellulosilyticum TaxID=2802395 RepID=A0A963Z1F7_9PROT|nr:RusA family crossover junction endodeoxyribonuclease [Acidisoma cellulosilyticum]MCB8880100.1 RusA family crossover junction endodeoxyribonuclease [Acidisoma cellulosilyticum]